LSAVDADRVDLRVPAESEGARLDQFLGDRAPRLTRSAWGRRIRDGAVTVDGVAASKPGLSLKAGMHVVGTLPAPAAAGPSPEEIPLDVIHEDDALIVVNKPAGMAVHPGHGRATGTLVHALLGRGTPLAASGAPARPGIVHRLDLGTSGAIVVAKTDEVHRALSAAFAERAVDKTYLALVWGHPDPEEGVIERAIGRSRTHAIKMSVTHTRGARRAALTEYRTLEAVPGFAWLEVRPRTGRTHQIRVHMQSLHHPLVGDDRYGGQGWRGIQDPLKRKALREFGRLALHASRLAFRHPATGRPVRYEAPLPREIERLLAALRSP
jgi:23S rRNA pseudouridine1911/1915/1917 synthase